MIMEMYSIRDTKTALFSQPFFAQNEASAKRQFDYLMLQAPMIAPDCGLYYVGAFDSETGAFSAVTPKFIKNAEVVDDVEVK